MTKGEWQIESKRATSHLSYALQPTGSFTQNEPGPGRYRRPTAIEEMVLEGSA